MSRWASRKRKKILIIVGVILLLLFIFTVIHIKNSKKPSCFDGIKNGTETGVDCGGSCQRVCGKETQNLIVWWERPFKVVNGVYNLVAYVENQNLEAGLERLDYEFRVYDKDNILATEPRRGTTFVEANKRFAIFEPSVKTGDREAYTVFFRILSKQDWKKVNPDFRYKFFQIHAPTLTKVRTAPHLKANVENTSLYDFSDVPVTAIIYNHRGNAIAASQTYIDRIQHGETKEVSFSWPESFGNDVARIEIIPRVNPFTDIKKAPQSTIS